jgi:hypothetical protein
MAMRTEVGLRGGRGSVTRVCFGLDVDTEVRR